MEPRISNEIKFSELEISVDNYLTEKKTFLEIRNEGSDDSDSCKNKVVRRAQSAPTSCDIRSLKNNDGAHHIPYLLNNNRWDEMESYDDIDNTPRIRIKLMDDNENGTQNTLRLGIIDNKNIYSLDDSLVDYSPSYRNLDLISNNTDNDYLLRNMNSPRELNDDIINTDIDESPRNNNNNRLFRLGTPRFNESFSLLNNNEKFNQSMNTRSPTTNCSKYENISYNNQSNIDNGSFSLNNDKTKISPFCLSPLTSYLQPQKDNYYSVDTTRVGTSCTSYPSEFNLSPPGSHLQYPLNDVEPPFLSLRRNENLQNNNKRFSHNNIQSNESIPLTTQQHNNTINESFFYSINKENEPAVSEFCLSPPIAHAQVGGFDFCLSPPLTTARCDTELQPLPFDLLKGNHSNNELNNLANAYSPVRRKYSNDDTESIVRSPRFKRMPQSTVQSPRNYLNSQINYSPKSSKCNQSLLLTPPTKYANPRGNDELLHLPLTGRPSAHSFSSLLEYSISEIDMTPTSNMATTPRTVVSTKSTKSKKGSRYRPASRKLRPINCPRCGAKGERSIDGGCGCTWIPRSPKSSITEDMIEEE